MCLFLPLSSAKKERHVVIGEIRRIAATKVSKTATDIGQDERERCFLILKDCLKDIAPVVHARGENCNNSDYDHASSERVSTPHPHKLARMFTSNDDLGNRHLSQKNHQTSFSSRNILLIGDGYMRTLTDSLCYENTLF